MKAVIHEKLHRYVFDKYYKQKYRIHGIDWIVLWFYHWLCEVNYNWRFDLHSQFRKYLRYSDYDRSGQNQEA
jgi:hypothetical protein